MPIRCVCPLGHPLLVPDELAGSDRNCPVCQQRVAIPVAGAAPAGGKVREVHAVDLVAGRSPADSTLEGLSPPSDEALVSVVRQPDVPPFDAPSAPRTSALTEPPVAAAVFPNQPRVYESRPAQIRAAYIMSSVTGAVAILGASPALLALRHPPVAGWVWLVLLFTLIEIAYALWLASLPDWSTLWVGMALGAAVAAIYALVLVAAMATPESRSLPIGLDDLRSSLGVWAVLLFALHGGLAYAAGWISSRWRRDYETWKLSASR